MDSLSSSSGLSKRARAYNNGTQVASCLVDGCNSDLSKCRDYHRRHKVCEVHSKTPTVTIRGQEQRFCQQCSRFHSLVEFDEEKRSCRKRLDGHNRRRRKSQPESFSLNSGRFLPSQQGTRFLPFSGPQIFLTTPVMSSAWDNTLKAQNDSVHYNGQSQLNFMNQKNSVIGSVSQSYGGGKQFPFLRGTDSTLPESSVYQPLDVIPKSEGSSRKMFPHEPNRVMNSDRALSLLSSPSAESRGIGLSHMVHPHAATSSQSLILARANYNPSGLDGLPMGYGSAANGTGSSDSYCQGMFSIEPDGSSASGSHQTHSFSWD